MAKSDPLTVTVDQAAELLGISRHTAYEAVRTGVLPSIRFGRRVIIPRSGLARMLGEPVSAIVTADDAGEAA